MFSGKENPLTKANFSQKELRAKLEQAIFKAFKFEGDEKTNKDQVRNIFNQAGMPMSGSLTPAQVNTVIRNIENRYLQDIAGKQAFLDSFNENSVSWE